MRVSTCTEADLSAVERHMPTGRNDAHAYHFARQQSGDADYLIAWIDDIPVAQGVITWTGFLEESVRAALPNCPAIGYLNVQQAHRGKGIGTAIVSAAEHRIAARGFRIAGIGVAIDNPQAARLYERLGYQDTSVTCEYQYTWFDDAGAAHDVTETSRYLVKELS